VVIGPTRVGPDDQGSGQDDDHQQKEYPSGEFTLAFVGYGDETGNTAIEHLQNWPLARLILQMNKEGSVYVGDARPLRGAGARL
jgi:hypothetical protein